MATIRITFEDMKQEFRRVLLKVGFTASRADQLAGIFAQNTRSILGHLHLLDPAGRGGDHLCPDRRLHLVL